MTKLTINIEPPLPLMTASEQEAEDWVALKRAEMGLGTFIAPSEVKLSEYMVEWLETHITPDVRQPINPQNWQRFWRKLLHQAGVPAKNFHALRHTHATKLLAAGMPLMDVSRRLGHAKPSHTLDLYGHAMPGQDDIIAGKIADIYNLPDKIEKPSEETDGNTERDGSPK